MHLARTEAMHLQWLVLNDVGYASCRGSEDSWEREREREKHRRTGADFMPGMTTPWRAVVVVVVVKGTLTRERVSSERGAGCRLTVHSRVHIDIRRQQCLHDKKPYVGSTTRTTGVSHCDVNLHATLNVPPQWTLPLSAAEKKIMNRWTHQSIEL